MKKNQLFKTKAIKGKHWNVNIELMFRFIEEEDNNIDIQIKLNHHKHFRSMVKHLHEFISRISYVTLKDSVINSIVLLATFQILDSILYMKDAFEKNDV